MKSQTQTNDPSAQAQAGAKEAVIAATLLLVLLGVGKPLAAAVPALASVIFTLAAGYQLYVPLWSIQRGGELPESHGIHVHGLLLGPIAWLRRRRVHTRKQSGSKSRSRLDKLLAYYGRGARFRGSALLKDLGLAVLVAVVTFVPFAFAQHYFRQYGLPAGKELVYAFRLPSDFGELFFKNLLLVALPEEAFYRGYLEHRLERVYKTRFHPLWIPIGITTITAASFFALGHFVGEWNLMRLGPFFPAFMFSLLTRKSGSITGAVFYHALSNVFSATLAAGYAIQSVS